MSHQVHSGPADINPKIAQGASMQVSFNPMTRAGWPTLPTASPRFNVTAQLHSQPSVSVSISLKAKQLNAQFETTAQANKLTPDQVDLKNYIKDIDFKSVTPAKLNELACKLVKCGEITPDQASALMGVEENSFPPKSATDAIDINKHFAGMLKTVKEAAENDPTFNYGVHWRLESIETLNAIQKYAYSANAHIRDDYT